VGQFESVLKGRFRRAVNASKSIAALEVAEKTRFWVAQRFQRCDNRPIIKARFSAWGKLLGRSTTFSATCLAAAGCVFQADPPRKIGESMAQTPPVKS